MASANASEPLAQRMASAEFGERLCCGASDDFVVVVSESFAYWPSPTHTEPRNGPKWKCLNAHFMFARDIRIRNEIK